MTLVLRGATLVDVELRRTLPGRSVLVEDGRIAALGDADDAFDDLTDAEVIDCRGRYLLPGLMDMHVHLRPLPHTGPHSSRSRSARPSAPVSPADVLPQLHSYLYCGVTSLFDAGNDASFIWALRDAERSGRVLAPRVFCAGPFVTCSGGHGSGMADAVEVNELPGDLPALRTHLARRPDLLKITYDEHGWGIRPLIPILDTETLRGIVETAHSDGLRVTVHASHELRAREAVECGTDTLAHPVIQSPITDDFVDQLSASRLPVVSTLAIGQRYPRLADDPAFLEEEAYAVCLDPKERARLASEEHLEQRRNRWADWMRVMTPVAQENLRRLVESGGVVAAGTDLSLGPELLHELVLLQEGGIEPWDVLTCATLNGARFLGMEQEIGSLRRGNVADLVLCDLDPSTDVSRLRHVSLVVKGGRVIDRSTLNLAGEWPARSAARFPRPLSA